MDDQGKGLATAGIWIGWGIACAFTPEAVPASIAALIATIAVWLIG